MRQEDSNEILMRQEVCNDKFMYRMSIRARGQE
jgi:hypothetical protein